MISELCRDELEELRRGLGISTIELAAMLGTQRKVVHGWLHGATRCGVMGLSGLVLSRMVKLAAAAGPAKVRRAGDAARALLENGEDLDALLVVFDVLAA